MYYILRLWNELENWAEREYEIAFIHLQLAYSEPTVCLLKPIDIIIVCKIYSTTTLNTNASMLDAHIHLPAHLKAISHWVRCVCVCVVCVCACVRVYSSDISIRRASDVYHTLAKVWLEPSIVMRWSYRQPIDTLQHIYFVRRSDVIVTSMPLCTHIHTNAATVTDSFSTHPSV